MVREEGLQKGLVQGVYEPVRSCDCPQALGIIVKAPHISMQ